MVGLEPSPVERSKAVKVLRNLDATIESISFEDATLDGKFDLITCVHSFYTIDEVYLRKIYESLTPPNEDKRRKGGVACIWIGDVTDNVMNEMCAALDRFLHRGPRNYARDIREALGRMGLGSGSGLSWRVFEAEVTGLLDGEELTERGKDVAHFFAMREPDANILRIARKVALDLAIRQPGGEIIHPLRDCLITFERLG